MNRNYWPYHTDDIIQAYANWLGRKYATESTLRYTPMKSRRSGMTNQQFASQREQRIAHLRGWVKQQTSFIVDDVEIWMNENGYDQVRSTTLRDLQTYTKEGWLTAKRISNGPNLYVVEANK